MYQCFLTSGTLNYGNEFLDFIGEYTWNKETAAEL